MSWQHVNRKDGSMETLRTRTSIQKVKWTSKVTFFVRIFNSKWKKFKSVTYTYQPYVSIYQDRPDINRLNPIQLPELFGTNWVLYLHLVCLNMFFPYWAIPVSATNLIFYITLIPVSVTQNSTFAFKEWSNTTFRKVNIMVQRLGEIVIRVGVWT